MFNILWSSVTLYPITRHQKESAAARLFRNGIQYYAVTSLINLLNAIFSTLNDPGLEGLFAAMAAVPPSVFSGRLILSHITSRSGSGSSRSGGGRKDKHDNKSGQQRSQASTRVCDPENLMMRTRSGSLLRDTLKNSAAGSSGGHSDVGVKSRMKRKAIPLSVLPLSTFGTGGQIAASTS